MQAIVVVTLVFLASYVAAYPGGAPPEACETMTPGHGIAPQDTPSPYLVSVNPANFAPDETVYVKISSFFDTDYYEGFMIQARDTDDKPVGKFEPSPIDDYQITDCPEDSGAQNTATHNRHEHFTTTDLIWTAPAVATNVTFKFSIVRGYNTFWTGITVPATMREA